MLEVAATPTPPIRPVRRASGDPRVRLVINPRAHANHHDPDRARLLARLIGRPEYVQMPRSLDELSEACTRLAAERPDIVAICGGDGTLHQTLTALIRCYGEEPLPQIAILRGGVMNIIADSIGVRGDSIEDLHALLSQRRRQIVNQAVMRIGDRYGFMFGTGLIYEFLRAYYATERPSRWTASWLLAKSISSAVVRGPLAQQIVHPVHARVIADGMAWTRERFIAVCAATIDQIGFGFRPFYRCRERPDRFALLGIDATRFGLVRELPRIRLGRPWRDSNVIDSVAHELSLVPTEPIGYTIDGDLYTSDRALEIKLGPMLAVVRVDSTR